MERKFNLLSNVMSTVLTGAAALVGEEPSYLFLQPVLTNVIEAGLLRDEYGTVDYVLNNPHTNESGISISGAFGGYMSGSLGIISDCYGNIALTLSPGFGGGTPGATFGGYSTWTNAPRVEDIKEWSTSVGGSFGIPGTPMSLGADIVSFCSTRTGETYYGISTNAGVSIWPAGVPAEMHGNASYTAVHEMTKLMEYFYGKAEGDGE